MSKEVIDLSLDDADMPDQPVPRAAAAVCQFSLCPVCQLSVPTSTFERHVHACLALHNAPQAASSPPSQPIVAAAASSSAALVASPSAAALSSQISQLQSLLSSQSPASLSAVAPQLAELEQQLHRALVPIATMSGLINVPIESSRLEAGEILQPPTAPRPGRHVLTSGAALTPFPPAAATSASSPPIARSISPASSSQSIASAHASTLSVSFTPSIHAAASSLPLDSDSNARAASDGFCLASDSDACMMSLEADQDHNMLSDEEFARQMQQEEHRAAAAERHERDEAAEREFQQLLQREGTCAKCGAAPSSPDQLIQICDELAQARANSLGSSSSPACRHKICEDCLRRYLSHIVQRLANPNLTSPTAASAAAAAAASPSKPLKPTSSLTEADLVCPYPACTSALSQWQMKRVLSASDFELLLSCTLRNSLHDGGGVGTAKFVSCPNVKCSNTFEAVPGSGVVASLGSAGSGAAAAAAANETGLDGQPMSAASKLHRSHHRFRCNECSTIFCGSCSTTPYHDGFDCAGWARYQTASKCRFCSTGLTSSNTARPQHERAEPFGHRAAALVGGVVDGLASLFGASSSSSSAAASSSSASAAAAAAAAAPPVLLDVCSSAECIEKRNHSCVRILGCGHACGGVRDERTCLPCLKEGCPSRNTGASRAGDVDEGDFCNICYIEELGQAPSLQLSCGHVFHARCITDKISKRWPGARITFGFLNCPLCGPAEIEHPSLASAMAPLLKLKAEVCAKAVARLKLENMDHEPAFESPSGAYYNRKSAYAMDRFAYYMCAKCKQPYFGGQRRCEDAAAAGANGEAFDPAHLVCGGCASGPDATNCALHGRDFNDHKCKFCCSVASFFCWGSTHFCAECHSKQESGDYVTRKPISELPVCAGPGHCPLGIKHPPNGTEFTLGCGVCRPRDC